MMELTNVDTRVQWKSFYKLAAVMALLIVAAGLVDSITSILGGAARENNTIGIQEWFSLFQNNRFYAFSRLGFINIVTLSLGIPIYLALLQAHWKTQPAVAILAVVFFYVGAAVYLSSNTVLSLYSLSRDYEAASEVQKVFLEASGRALLARGADLTPGTFMGFFFTQIAGLLVSEVILVGRVFSKWTGWLGLAGYFLMSVFFVLMAFAPGRYDTAILISMPGGLLLLGYQIMLALGFLKLARS